MPMRYAAWSTVARPIAHSIHIAMILYIGIIIECVTSRKRKNCFRSCCEGWGWICWWTENRWFNKVSFMGMPSMNINSDWISNASSCLYIILGYLESSHCILVILFLAPLSFLSTFLSLLSLFFSLLFSFFPFFFSLFFSCFVLHLFLSLLFLKYFFLWLVFNIPIFYFLLVCTSPIFLLPLLFFQLLFIVTFLGFLSAFVDLTVIVCVCQGELLHLKKLIKLHSNIFICM